VKLRNTADLCAKDSVSIDDKFDEYRELIKELSQACEQQQGLTTSKIKDTARDLEAENSRLAGQERAVQAAEGLARRLEQELTVASEAYKKASDEFPSG
jgi:DNA repair ATPase RecN